MYMVLTTEGFFEVAIESWTDNDLVSSSVIIINLFVIIIAT